MSTAFGRGKVASLASLCALVALLSMSRPAAGQTTASQAMADSVLVVPGESYQAGSTYRRLFGNGYRDLWTTAIQVPVLDIAILGGGAVPTRLGGGMTTKTLHLDGADGRRYVLRSVDKAPVEFEDFAGSALEELIQDQVSSFHPTGAPIVAHLLSAVGVLHPEPFFAVVPDDPALGDFRDEFAGLLVLVEERPDDGPDGTIGFAGSRRIVQTDDLFDDLEESPQNQVASEELLKARLIDILVGDRDRSHNNHLWASFPSGDGGTLWRVVPRDRDQAFVRFDGLLKTLARRYDRRLIAFDEAYPNIFAMTRNAWDIDRALLVGIDRAAWNEIVLEVQAEISDGVISEAVRRLPREHFAVIGPDMESALRSRRDHLPEAAEALYRAVFSYADIQATDEDEELHVVRGLDDLVQVTLRQGGDGTVPFFERVFSSSETSEIRIYMHGGDDRVVLQGAGAEDVLVRIVGGGGRDSFVDESWQPQSQTVLYDDGGATSFPADGAAQVRHDSPRRPFSWFELDRDLDWGSLTVPEPTAGFGPDRGLVLVPGIKSDRFGFGKRPYSERIQLQAGWAFGLNEPIINYSHLARDLIGGVDLRLKFRWSGMEIMNFYGFGNETVSPQPTSYHRVTHKQVRSTLAASIGDGERRYLEVGPVFTYTSTDTTTANSFIADNDPYGSGKFSHAGVLASFGIDGRDELGTPHRGYRLEGGLGLYPKIRDASDNAFGEAHAEAATYFSAPGGNPVLALRGMGKLVWGRFPFTEAAFLGGANSVRSLPTQRYAGDAVVVGNVELRLRLGRVRFPIPTDVGLFALGDRGRVFVDGEDSSTWYSAVGGGVWFALLGGQNVIQLSVASGAGVTNVHAGVGFAH